MSRAKPASAESVVGVVTDADVSPKVENRPIANARAAISSMPRAITGQRRVPPPDGLALMAGSYCLPGASTPPVQAAFGSGAFWLRQYSSMNCGIRLSSAESTFSWWFQALTTMGESRPRYGDSTEYVEG